MSKLENPKTPIKCRQSKMVPCTTFALLTERTSASILGVKDARSTRRHLPEDGRAFFWSKWSQGYTLFDQPTGRTSACILEEKVPRSTRRLSSGDGSASTLFLSILVSSPSARPTERTSMYILIACARNVASCFSLRFCVRQKSQTKHPIFGFMLPAAAPPKTADE